LSENKYYKVFFVASLSDVRVKNSNVAIQVQHWECVICYCMVITVKQSLLEDLCSRFPAVGLVVGSTQQVGMFVKELVVEQSMQTLHDCCMFLPCLE